MADNRGDIEQAGPVKRQMRKMGLSYRYMPSPLSQSTSSADIEAAPTANPQATASNLPQNDFSSTTQTNETSAQQQQGNAGGTQPPAAAGGTGLFGSQTQNQQSQQPAAASSLFGAQPNQQQQAQQQGGTSLFNTLPGAQKTAAGGLFGAGTQQPNVQNTAAGSLFGGSALNRSSTLFGGNTAAPANQGTSSLFGNQQPQQQQGTSSLFGAQQNQPQASTSLFGAQQNQQNQQQQQQQQQQGSSLFGLTATQPSYNQGASLLGASQYRANQYQPFSGRLTMGQQQSNAAGGGAGGAAAGGAGASTTAQGAVQINFDSMRPTTRFNDCIPAIQADLEKMDSMIAAQERFCREIEAFIPKHGDNVRTLQPDVEMITEKLDSAESNLSADAQQVETEKAVLAKDGKDGERVRRVIDNIRQPRDFQYTNFAQNRSVPDGADGSVVRDMDLIGNYFVPLTSSLQNTVNAYSSNLAEIEQHLRVIEASAVAQAQQLAAKRAGVRTEGAQSGEETVRELAETLRGFEASILGAASQVGHCREGLNELVLGKLGR